MKDKDGLVLRRESDIIKRWNKCFEKLMNEENERYLRGLGDPNHGVVRDISRDEVVLGLKKIKNGKAPGPDGLPIETWRALRNEGIDTLWSLMQMIFHEERMPDSWIQSMLIPIFKDKGDVQLRMHVRTTEV